MGSKNSSHDGGPVLCNVVRGARKGGKGKSEGEWQKGVSGNFLKHRDVNEIGIGRRS